MGKPENLRTHWRNKRTFHRRDNLGGKSFETDNSNGSDHWYNCSSNYRTHYKTHCAGYDDRTCLRPSSSFSLTSTVLNVLTNTAMH